ncbi:MAG: VacJ family lipoprotein [Dongiaceae bacterium]
MLKKVVFGQAAMAGVVALTLVTSGCAAKPDPNDEAAVEAYKEANDPFEPMNRYFFEVNQFLDEVIMKPFAGYYNIALPQFAKDSIRNALRNVNSPVILANDLFQGEGERAETTSMRFVINTTLGVGGLMDVAKNFGYVYHDEDFGQTLAVWGSGEGPYLHLPIIGPTNPRDLTGKGVDKLLDPLTWIAYFYDISPTNTVLAGLDALDTRSRNLEALDELKKGSIDFYATIRSLYRQQRADAIRNGKEADDLTPSLTSESMIPDDNTNGSVVRVNPSQPAPAGQMSDAQ